MSKPSPVHPTIRPQTLSSVLFNLFSVVFVFIKRQSPSNFPSEEAVCLHDRFVQQIMEICTERVLFFMLCSVEFSFTVFFNTMKPTGVKLQPEFLEKFPYLTIWILFNLLKPKQFLRSTVTS